MFLAPSELASAMETIPDEIYEIICGMLSSRELANAVLIDRYSRFIIENSPVLMDKLPLIITDCENNEFCDTENQKLIQPLLESRRKVTKVVIRLKQERIMKFLQVFKKFGATTRTLEIHDYSFDTIDQLRMILRYFTNLCRLKVENVSFQKHENKILNAIVQVPKLTLPQLREIDCVHTDPKIFTLFASNHDIQLRAIRLRSNDAQYHRYTEFVDLLIRQTGLRHLVLEGLSSENSDVFECRNLLRCQLSTLAIRNCSFSVRHQQMQNLIDTVKSQKKLARLTFLETEIPAAMTLRAYRQIFANWVTEADLDIGDLSVFHTHHFTNRTIRYLTLHGNFAFENLPIFINFLKIFPNTTHLTLRGNLPIGEKYLFNILTILENLEQLRIPGFTSRHKDSNFANLSNLPSPKLNTLILNYIDYDVKYFSWKNIVTNLSSIETLVIKRDYGKVSNEIIDVMVETLKLKHLELGIGIVSEEILGSILNNSCCDKLKVLKIPKSEYEGIQNKRDFEKILASSCLLLYLCDDEYFISK